MRFFGDAASRTEGAFSALSELSVPVGRAAVPIGLPAPALSTRENDVVDPFISLIKARISAKSLAGRSTTVAVANASAAKRDKI